MMSERPLAPSTRSRPCPAALLRLLPFLKGGSKQSTAVHAERRKRIGSYSQTEQPNGAPAERSPAAAFRDGAKSMRAIPSMPPMRAMRAAAERAAAGWAPATWMIPRATSRAGKWLDPGGHRLVQRGEGYVYGGGVGSPSSAAPPAVCLPLSPPKKPEPHKTRAEQQERRWQWHDGGGRAEKLRRR